tara:strand:- start:29905 stop:31179 length:1275 start_codon:yes stop_codon:yes gene_type:complete
MNMTISRRRLIQTSIGAGIIGGLGIILKPKDIGEDHSAYFKNLSLSIKQAEFTKPTLIIDKQRLDKNIDTLKRHINQRYQYRIVVKSLPSIPLLKHISEKVNSQRFMVFDESFLIKMLEQFPQGDFLLGKPLPVLSARKVLSKTEAFTGTPIRWLVDSMQRLMNYRQLAQEQKQTLHINLEIDVGLHRGGFSSEQALSEALAIIRSDPFLKFDGFMGYEPHVVKLPGNSASHLTDSLSIYHRYIEIAEEILGTDFPDTPIFNTAGSPSYQLHTKLTAKQSLCNELSAGSCLVKPTDFDLPSLADHLPTSFIATPILKTLDQTKIPGITRLGEIMAWWNPNLKRSLFTYGGNWKAKLTSPEGLSYNPLYGRSSNQEMINASIHNPLGMNDWIFLRPTQSESVFLQFGDIAIYDGNAFIEHWSVFS